MYANERLETTRNATGQPGTTRNDPTRPETIQAEPGGTERPQDANATDLLSVGEAAQELGLLMSKVDRAMRNGRLAYVRVGARRDRFVTRSDLEAWAATLPQAG